MKDNNLNARDLSSNLRANRDDYLSSKVAADVDSISNSIDGILDDISSLENDVQVERDRLEKERLKEETQDTDDITIEEN